MEQEEQVRNLMRLGLTGYEARVYLGLLGRGDHSAAEVARQAQVPRQRVYDVLESLVEKGLASVRPGAVARFAAEEPTAAISRLVDGHRRSLAALERQAITMAEELAPAYRAGRERTDPLDYIEVLRDAGAISSRFDELQAGVQREILVFNKPPYAIPVQDNVTGLPLASRVVARGMYEYELFDDPAATDGVRRFMSEGEDVRFVPELPMKLVVLDENIVMFGMEDPVPDAHELTIVVVEHPSLARVLKQAFNAYWATGLTFDEAYERCGAPGEVSA